MHWILHKNVRKFFFRRETKSKELSLLVLLRRCFFLLRFIFTHSLSLSARNYRPRYMIFFLLMKQSISSPQRTCTYSTIWVIEHNILQLRICVFFFFSIFRETGYQVICVRLLWLFSAVETGRMLSESKMKTANKNKLVSNKRIDKETTKTTFYVLCATVVKRGGSFVSHIIWPLRENEPDDHISICSVSLIEMLLHLRFNFHRTKKTEEKPKMRVVLFCMCMRCCFILLLL